jgi:hypothetical protein
VVGCSVVGSDDTATVTRYLQYKEMPRITEQMIAVSSSMTEMCFDPGTRIDPGTTHGPHVRPGIHLYANPKAIAARKPESATERFPVGSLLVKEKFDTRQDATPSVITVMEKVADRAVIDDWKFYMIRISDRTIVRDGFKVSCRECHSHYSKSDFVSHVTDRILRTSAQKH